MIDAATALLVEAGPRGVTVDAVCERSGVAKSTLYRHWGSREDLLVEVLRCNLPEVSDVDLADGFDAALRQHMANVACTFADPEWARIMPALFMLKNQVHQVDELTQDDRDHKLGQLGRILQLGIDEGRLPSDLDPATAAAVLFGPLMFVTLVGEGDLGRVASFAVERFLASYPAPA